MRQWLRQLRAQRAAQEEGGDKKRVNPLVVWGILIAVALLALSGIFGQEKGKPEAQPPPDSAAEQARGGLEEYIRSEERRLEQILSRVRGAGEVKVMVRVEDEGEKVIATDSKACSEQRDGQTEPLALRTETEESTVLAGQGSSQQPFVLKEKQPCPSGVIVLAQGAGDERVRLELYEAVKALYGISAHRIRVSAAAGEETGSENE